MSKYYIWEVVKRIDHRDPISGHQWSTYENPTHGRWGRPYKPTYEVAGGKYAVSRFRSLKKAQEHIEALERLDKIIEGLNND